MAFVRLKSHCQSRTICNFIRPSHATSLFLLSSRGKKTETRELIPNFTELTKSSETDVSNFNNWQQNYETRAYIYDKISTFSLNMCTKIIDNLYDFNIFANLGIIFTISTLYCQK